MFRPQGQIRWFTLVSRLLVGSLLFASCTRSDGSLPAGQSGGGPTVALSSTGPPPDVPPPSCDPTVIGSDGLAWLEFAVDELARVDAGLEPLSGEGCGVSRHPLCTAIFLIAATDPIVGVADGFGPADLARLGDLHERSLALATELAARADRNRLADAFRRLTTLDVSAAVLSGDDDAMIELVIARAAPEILTPISSAEAGC